MIAAKASTACSLVGLEKKVDLSNWYAIHVNIRTVPRRNVLECRSSGSSKEKLFPNPRREAPAAESRYHEDEIRMNFGMELFG